MKHTYIISLFVFLFSHSFMNAQNSRTINGSVIEKTSKEPMEFVTIALFRTSDSVTVNSVFSDKKGGYTINNIPNGEYYLKTYFVGFHDTTVSSIIINDNTSILTLPPIVIRAMSNVLGEVEISAEKDLYQTTVDKKIYNVDKDIQSKSGSASDVLKNVPSVSVDIDGTVSLRGSTNLTIFINGKPSPLMKISAADALMSIPANTIEKIEVITSPSAKYRTDGAGGIINIVLKKTNKAGLNGTLSANVGNDDRYNSTLSLNYQLNKFNFFGSYGYRQDYRYKSKNDERIQYDSLGRMVNSYNQTTENYGYPYSHMGQLNVDYAINKSNDLGLSLSLFDKRVTKTDNTVTLFKDSTNFILSDFDRHNIDPEKEYENELSLEFEHRFKKEDHTLAFDVTFADLAEQEHNHFTETYRSPSDQIIKQNTLLKDGMRQVQSNLVYTLPIKEGSLLEAGYYSEIIHQDMNFYGESYISNTEAWAVDKNKTNHFLFDQQVHALFLTYTHEIEDLTVMAGLRGEQVYLNSNLLTLDSVIAKNYFKLFPSLHLSYDLSDKHKLQLSYSKRINRPEGDQLNPFPEYKNAINIDAGNPNLKPEQIHSVELGYQGKGDKLTLLPTIYYRYTYDAFTEISRYLNDTVLLTTQQNLSSNQSAGLELVVTGKVKKLLTLNLSGNAYYNQIDASNLGYSSIKSAFIWTSKLAANLNITSTTMLQINTSYFSKQLTPQGNYLPIFVLNTGVSQDIFKKKASLVFTVSDVFNTLRSKGEINTPLLYQSTLNKRKSQIIYLGFSWRFGYNAKPSKEKMSFDEKI